jgi:hypothetical protein
MSNIGKRPGSVDDSFVGGFSYAAGRDKQGYYYSIFWEVSGRKSYIVKFVSCESLQEADDKAQKIVNGLNEIKLEW